MLRCPIFRSHVFFLYNSSSHEKHFLFFHSFLSIFHITFLSFSLIKSVLGLDFTNAAKNRGLKIGTDVAQYCQQDSRVRVLKSATISGTGMSDPNEFRDLRNGVYLNHGIDAGLIFMSVVIFCKQSLCFFVPMNFTALRPVNSQKTYEPSPHVASLKELTFHQRLSRRKI